MFLIKASHFRCRMIRNTTIKSLSHRSFFIFIFVSIKEYIMYSLVVFCFSILIAIFQISMIIMLVISMIFFITLRFSISITKDSKSQANNRHWLFLCIFFSPSFIPATKKLRIVIAFKLHRARKLLTLIPLLTSFYFLCIIADKEKDMAGMKIYRCCMKSINNVLALFFLRPLRDSSQSWLNFLTLPGHYWENYCRFKEKYKAVEETALIFVSMTLHLSPLSSSLVAFLPPVILNNEINFVTFLELHSLSI